MAVGTPYLASARTAQRHYFEQLFYCCYSHYLAAAII
jgi:hypothetical protein